jgi:hypothetical protein
MGRDAVASINGTDTPLWQLPREEYEAGVRNASVMFFPFVREMLRSYLVRMQPDRCSWSSSLPVSVQLRFALHDGGLAAQRSKWAACVASRAAS